MAKTKYADGGMTQQPTYPFYGNQPQAGGQNGGTNQTFNMQPQANAGVPEQQQQTFKKGGSVNVKKMALGGIGSRPAPARPMPPQVGSRPAPMPPQVGSRPPPPPPPNPLRINRPPTTTAPRASNVMGKPPMSSAMSLLGNKALMKKGGKVSSASSRADGCAIRGKTRA
jgi:hypothetical protein